MDEICNHLPFVHRDMGVISLGLKPVMVILKTEMIYCIIFGHFLDDCYWLVLIGFHHLSSVNPSLFQCKQLIEVSHEGYSRSCIS